MGIEDVAAMTSSHDDRVSGNSPGQVIPIKSTPRDPSMVLLLVLRSAVCELCVRVSVRNNEQQWEAARRSEKQRAAVESSETQ